MQLRRFDNVKAFWQCAQNYLLQYAVEHNALLGFLHTLLHYPERYLEYSISKFLLAAPFAQISVWAIGVAVIA